MTIVNVMPPSNGNNNSISFNGRTYSSRPGVAIPVLDFDAPVLQANGWTLAALGSVGEAGRLGCAGCIELREAKTLSSCRFSSDR
jgi:hypothetical protein